MPAVKQNIDMVLEQVPFNSKLRESGVYISAQDQDMSKPKPIYVENLMPISRGYATSTIRESFAVFPLPTYEDPSKTNIHIVYNYSNQISYLLEDFGKVYIFLPDTQTWNLLHSAQDSSIQYSVFFLKGTTYVFHKEMGVYKFGNTFNDWEEVTINGTTDFNPKTTVIAMTSALSYMIGVTHNEVYWSDPIDETQFDPTATISLAGATKVLALRGEVQLVLPITDGFIIYTNVNAVSATYSQNPNNPFIFKEVANSTGAFSQTHVTYKTSLPVHFIWGDFGLMQLGHQSAEVIFPELTDFLGGDVIERWNYDTDQIEVEEGVGISTKLTYLNSRYIGISYGKFEGMYEFLLLYDMILKRWGKMRIAHKAIFNMLPPHMIGGVTFNQAKAEGINFDHWYDVRFVDVLAKLSEANFNVGVIGILDANNNMRAVDWLDDTRRGEGLILFGEIAVSRSRISSLSEVEVHGALVKEDLELRVRSKTYDTAWKDMIYVPRYDWYVANSAGKTHELLIKGSMQLTAVVNKLTYSGME